MTIFLPFTRLNSHGNYDTRFPVSVNMSTSPVIFCIRAIPDTSESVETGHTEFI